MKKLSASLVFAAACVLFSPLARAVEVNLPGEAAPLEAVPAPLQGSVVPGAADVAPILEVDPLAAASTVIPAADQALTPDGTTRAAEKPAVSQVVAAAANANAQLAATVERAATPGEEINASARAAFGRLIGEKQITADGAVAEAPAYVAPPTHDILNKLGIREKILTGGGVELDAAGKPKPVAEPLRVSIFDNDDNVRYYFTKIYLRRKGTGEEVGISTEKFAEVRTTIGKSGEYADYTIFDEADGGSFRDFVDTRDPDIFPKAVRESVATLGPKARGPSWFAWAKALKDPKRAKWVGVITSRGHQSVNMQRGFHEDEASGRTASTPRAELLLGAGAHSPMDKFLPKEMKIPERKVEVLIELLDLVQSVPLINPSDVHSAGFSDDDADMIARVKKRLYEEQVIHGRWPNVKISLFATGPGIESTDILTTKRPAPETRRPQRPVYRLPADATPEQVLRDLAENPPSAVVLDYDGTLTDRVNGRSNPPRPETIAAIEAVLRAGIPVVVSSARDFDRKHGVIFKDTGELIRYEINDELISKIAPALRKHLYFIGDLGAQLVSFDEAGNPVRHLETTWTEDERVKIFSFIDQDLERFGLNKPEISIIDSLPGQVVMKFFGADMAKAEEFGNVLHQQLLAAGIPYQINSNSTGWVYFGKFKKSDGTRLAYTLLRGRGYPVTPESLLFMGDEMRANPGQREGADAGMLSPFPDSRGITVGDSPSDQLPKNVHRIGVRGSTGTERALAAILIGVNAPPK